MNTYEIPRSYKGESRILYIFSIKGLVWTVGGLAVGLIFYFLFKIIGLEVIGIIIDILFGVIGFCIATFKIPDTKKFQFTQKTGGENIDDVIKRWVKFKKNKNKIFIWKQTVEKEENK